MLSVNIQSYWYPVSIFQYRETCNFTRKTRKVIKTICRISVEIKWNFIYVHVCSKLQVPLKWNEREGGKEKNITPLSKWMSLFFTSSTLVSRSISLANGQRDVLIVAKPYRARPTFFLDEHWYSRQNPTVADDTPARNDTGSARRDTSSRRPHRSWFLLVIDSIKGERGRERDKEREKNNPP